MAQRHAPGRVRVNQPNWQCKEDDNVNPGFFSRCTKCDKDRADVEKPGGPPVAATPPAGTPPAPASGTPASPPTTPASTPPAPPVTQQQAQPVQVVLDPNALAAAIVAAQQATQGRGQQEQPPSPPPAPSYYVMVEGAQQGPFTLAELRPRAQAGTLKRETMVWTTGMANWAPAKDVPQLAEVISLIPPPLPAQPPGNHGNGNGHGNGGHDEHGNAHGGHAQQQDSGSMWDLSSFFKRG